MITIECKPEYERILSKRKTTAVIRYAFTLLGISPEPEITILLTNDEEIQQLNSQFRGFDKPTDVLSFDSGEINPETGVPYLGDIVISVPTARLQSDQAAHPLQNELLLLIVHGLLHLCGYDHDTLIHKKEMWALQSQILHHFGVQINLIPEGN